MFMKTFFIIAFGLMIIGFSLNASTVQAQQRTIVSEEDLMEDSQVVPAPESNKSLYTITALGLLIVAGGALYVFWVQTGPGEVVEESKLKSKPKPRPKK
jgi:hypothetical protein